MLFSQACLDVNVNVNMYALNVTSIWMIDFRLLLLLMTSLAEVNLDATSVFHSLMTAISLEPNQMVRFACFHYWRDNEVGKKDSPADIVCFAHFARFPSCDEFQNRWKILPSWIFNTWTQMNTRCQYIFYHLKWIWQINWL